MEYELWVVDSRLVSSNRDCLDAPHPHPSPERICKAQRILSVPGGACRAIWRNKPHSVIFCVLLERKTGRFSVFG